MEAETFELSATVEQYVEPFASFADPVEDAADAFVVVEPVYEFPWLDGVTEVPEGYLWPEQIAEMEAQAAFDAWQFTPEWYAEVMGAFGHAGAVIEMPEFALITG